MSEDAKASGDDCLTLLDRRLQVLVDDPDFTGSRKNGISVRIEKLHRLQGASLIFEASRRINVRTSTCATACSIFHRFFHQASLVNHDVWSVAQASLLLATKVEEEPCQISAVIHAFCHAYAKRLLYFADPVEKSSTASDNPLICCIKGAQQMPLATKEAHLQRRSLPMKLGPVYKEWYEQMRKAETDILSQLGFILYWIPDSHPHKFILYFCQVLGIKDKKVSPRPPSRICLRAPLLPPEKSQLLSFCR